MMAEPEYAQMRLTIEALPATEPHESVIDVQCQHWSPLVVVAQEIGDRPA